MSGEITVTKGYNWNSSGETVTAAKLNSTALPVAKVQQGAITNVEIADGTISADKIDSALASQLSLEDDAVTTAKILNSAVTTAKINALAVTTAKLAGDAVTGDKLADNAVDSEHYTEGSIDAAHLSATAVTAAGIAANTIVPAKMSGMIVYTGYAKFVDSKSSGTNGGTAVSKAWTTRALTNQDVDIGAIASISGVDGIITLANTGNFFCRITSPYFNTLGVQTRLQNTTGGGATEILGSVENAGVPGSGSGESRASTVRSEISGYFSATASDTIVVQYFADVGQANNGLGRAWSNAGNREDGPTTNEVYTIVEIWQVDITDI